MIVTRAFVCIHGCVQRGLECREALVTWSWTDRRSWETHSGLFCKAEAFQSTTKQNSSCKDGDHEEPQRPDSKRGKKRKEEQKSPQGFFQETPFEKYEQLETRLESCRGTFYVLALVFVVRLLTPESPMRSETKVPKL